MEEKKHKILTIIRTTISRQTVIVIVLLILCIFEIQSIASSVDEIRGERVAGYGQRQSIQAFLGFDSLTPADIQPWMTFSYINAVFKLPEEYLQAHMYISDPQYPNISIGRFVRRNHINGLLFITQLQQVVAVYKK
jgi:hypothetical protein